ncbi:hypothetical protein Goari_004914, partial [Gossypium aridum]|nr:hypothetical protein [Gossypium aridum]
MGTGKEDTAVFLDRASRSTRGRRMTKLLDEEFEEDELFWNQEAFKEVQAHSYSSENTLTIFLDYRIDVDILEY